jgi:large subunit ribosomal protein L6
MSRLGKQTIEIPNGTEVSIEHEMVVVKGPKGENARQFLSEVSVSLENGGVRLTPTTTTEFSKALLGTYTSHIKNMIYGVNSGFCKKLVVEGVGYKVQVNDRILTLTVGFSHPVDVKIPEGIEVSVEKNIVTVNGINKESVGAFAAAVRSVKKPEPYKGKGIRYDNEIIRRKQGKKAVT